MPLSELTERMRTSNDRLLSSLETLTRVHAHRRECAEVRQASREAREAQRRWRKEVEGKWT